MVKATSQGYKPLLRLRGSFPQLVRPHSKKSKVEDTHKKGEMTKKGSWHYRQIFSFFFDWFPSPYSLVIDLSRY